MLTCAYASEQAPVEFKPATWTPRLSSWPALERILTDNRYSVDIGSGRRTITRQNVRTAIRAMDLTVSEQVRAAFTLTVLWGSGVRSRSYRNLPRALTAADCVTQLRTAAIACRGGNYGEAYRTMALPGIGPAFFTKWFAFAGHVANNPRNPLILDARVRRTLTQTLSIGADELGGSRVSPATRYVAYIELLHQWADQLRAQGSNVNAEKIEYALFAHNGRPLLNETKPC